MARDRAANRVWNQLFALDGHQGAEYRYGQRLEEEDQRHARSYVPDLGRPRVDPSRQRLYAGQVVFLPPGLHRFVHDPARPAAERAHALLQHTGHGNLPRSSDYTGYWNTTADSAFENTALSQLFQDALLAAPTTHLVYRAEPLTGRADDLPLHKAGFTYVDYTDPADIPVELTGLSWRRGSDLDTVHHTPFDRPVQASLAPEEPKDASVQYRARYDESGRLRPPPPDSAAPFEERRAEIRGQAEGLIRASAQRSRHGARASRPSAPDPVQPSVRPQRPGGAGPRL